MACWSLTKTDDDNRTRTLNFNVSGGEFAVRFEGDYGGHHLTGPDLLFLNDVLPEAIKRLEAELETKEPRAGKRWTTDEEAKLQAYLTQGHTLEEIAAFLERAYSAIVSRALRLGLIDIIPKQHPPKIQLRPSAQAR